MKSRSTIVVFVSALLVAAAYGGRSWLARRAAQAAARALAQAAQWTPSAQRAARVMIERYGPPQEASSFELRWNGPLPWKRIVIQDEPQAPLEQVVEYDVPANKLAALDRFPHGLRVYPAEGALGARSDREDRNLLSLNLAVEIASGKTTPEDANRFFVRTLRLHEAGKSSPYMERLLFKRRIKPDFEFPPP
jgi:hypothetical protein